MKYTKEYLKDNYVIVFIPDEEAYNKLSDYCGKRIALQWQGPYYYCPKSSEYSSSSTKDDIGVYKTKYPGDRVYEVATMEDIFPRKISHYILVQDLLSDKAGTRVVKQSGTYITENGEVFRASTVENNLNYFTPVYRETFKVGDYVCETWKASPDTTRAYKVLKVVNSTIHYSRDGDSQVSSKLLRKATPEEIEKATLVTIGNYKAIKEGDLIAFGCQKFTKEELIGIKKLFNSEINATINIKGVFITSEILDKLLDL